MRHVANGTGRRGMVSAAGQVDPTPLPSPSAGASRLVSFRGFNYSRVQERVQERVRGRVRERVRERVLERVQEGVREGVRERVRESEGEF